MSPCSLLATAASAPVHTRLVLRRLRDGSGARKPVQEGLSLVLVAKHCGGRTAVHLTERRLDEARLRCQWTARWLTAVHISRRQET